MAIQLIYQEKDVEDLLEKDCEYFLGLRFVTRQFKTGVGIVDVIARAGRVGKQTLYYVIELKKDNLDANAYVQAVRYAKWLNSEYSKDWCRLFVPLLIGLNIATELHTVCETFFHGMEGWYGLIGRVFYTLFHFDPQRGVRFDYHSTIQKRYRDSLEHGHCHIEGLWIDYGFLEANYESLDMEADDLRRKSEDIARKSHLRLVEKFPDAEPLIEEMAL